MSFKFPRSVEFNANIKHAVIVFEISTAHTFTKEMIVLREILAGNICRYRKDLKLTQEALAQKLGVTFQAVSKWETGQTIPDTTLLPDLAIALNVSIDKLLGYTAFSSDDSYYERAYRKDDYYWGVEPNTACLKVIELLPPTKPLKLLDIGCGEGKDAVFFARCGYVVSAFDISEAGVKKTKRLAEKAMVNVRAFRANLCDYRLTEDYDVLFSSGVLHYIKPELREEIINDYKIHTNINGINVFNVFVEKPFIAPPPENEEHSHLWRSGQLLAYYHDWFIEDFSESVFDCVSSGIRHKHAMNELYSRRK